MSSWCFHGDSLSSLRLTKLLLKSLKLNQGLFTTNPLRRKHLVSAEIYYNNQSISVGMIGSTQLAVVFLEHLDCDSTETILVVENRI